MKPWGHGQIVPDGWAAHHRPIIHGFFCDTATVRRRAGRQVVDDLGTLGDVWTDVTPTGGVPALIQVTHRQAANERDAAGQPLIVTDYYGRLDVEWLPQTGDRVVVTASPDPANLGTYVVRRRESQGHVVDRTVHLERVEPDSD